MRPHYLLLYLLLTTLLLTTLFLLLLLHPTSYLENVQGQVRDAQVDLVSVRGSVRVRVC